MDRYLAALRRAQMDIDVHPEQQELPPAGRSGEIPGAGRRADVQHRERIAFLPYAREVFAETQQWIESRQFFAGASAQAGYDEAAMT